RRGVRARTQAGRRLDRRGRLGALRCGALLTVLADGVLAAVHHVALVPQLDLIRLHEGAALVGIPAAVRRERHDDARHCPAGHAARPPRRFPARACVVAVAAALVLPAAAAAQGPTPTPTVIPTPTPTPTPVPTP